MYCVSSQADSEQHAKEVCDYRRGILQNKRQQVAIPFKETETGAGGTIAVPLIVKGDVAGSVEALVEVIKSRNPENFELKIIQSGVGAVNESDVEMAASSKGKDCHFTMYLACFIEEYLFSTDCWFQCVGK